VPVETVMAPPPGGLTPCMPCSFGLLRSATSGADAQHIDLHRVTASVRWISLVTAAYGTRVARPASTLTLRPGGDGSQLNRRVRSVLGDHRLVAKSPQGSRQRGWGDSNSTSPILSAPGHGAVGGATCDFDKRLVTARARCCPSFTPRLRTQYGPREPFARRRPPCDEDHIQPVPASLGSHGGSA
jgi:hypothetical protein